MRVAKFGPFVYSLTFKPPTQQSNNNNVYDDDNDDGNDVLQLE